MGREGYNMVLWLGGERRRLNLAGQGQGGARVSGPKGGRGSMLPERKGVRGGHSRQNMEKLKSPRTLRRCVPSSPLPSLSVPNAPRRTGDARFKRAESRRNVLPSLNASSRSPVSNCSCSSRSSCCSSLRILNAGSGPAALEVLDFPLALPCCAS